MAMGQGEVSLAGGGRQPGLFRIFIDNSTNISEDENTSNFRGFMMLKNMKIIPF